MRFLFTSVAALGLGAGGALAPGGQYTASEPHATSSLPPSGQ